MTTNIPTTWPELERWTEVGTSTTANDDVSTLLAGDQVPLKMKSRNLNYKEVGEDLTNQLKEYMLKEAKSETMVIWVSGWVDSGLVSTLAARTWMKLIVVEMPINQVEWAEIRSRAQDHIEWLQENFPNVEHLVKDGTGMFEAYKEILPEVKENDPGMSLVNTRSRVRSTILRGLANDNGGIVLGTGNRVEDYGIGFFTKGGDGDVDVSPIWELYKSEVRALSRELWIGDAISDAVATDGLHTDGATDEDQIGCTYDELEWAMVEYDEGRRTEDFIARAREVMDIYTGRHEGSSHKMSMPKVFELKLAA